MGCIYLSKSMNGRMKCKKKKKEILLDECYQCLDFEYKKNKVIKKTNNKKIAVKKEIYDEVYKRDKGRCRLCGSYKDLQLHHIVYRSEDKKLINEPSNCIMLCINCHNLVHSNKHRWQSELKNIILKEILEDEH